MSRGSKQLDRVYLCVVLFGLQPPPSGGGASPFIDEGDGFTRVSGLGSMLYLASLPILMGAKGR